MEEFLLEAFQPDLEVVKLISELLESMDIQALSDCTEIKEERLLKILSLEGNPSLGEIKRIAKVAGKKVKLIFEV